MTRDRLARCWILVSAATAGAIVMAVELLGARVLSVVFGGSLAVWAGMISVALLSLAGGYFAGGILADRFPRPAPFYSLLLAASVLTAVCPYVTGVLKFCFTAFGLQWGTVAGAAVLFALPLAVLGSTSPWAVRLIGENGKSTGMATGSVYAVSTLGSVTGTLLAGFWLIPTHGVSLSFKILAAFGAVVASAGLLGAAGRKGLKWLAVPLAIVGLPFPSGFGSACRAPDGDPVVVNAVIESSYGRTTVLTKGRRRLMVTGGTVQTGIPEGEIARGAMLRNGYHLELIPYLVKNPGRSRVLLVGLGGGLAATLFRKYDMEVDCVEIDDKVIDAARRWFAFTGNAIEGDGRVYIETCQARYDVCVVDAYAGDSLPAHLVSVEAFGAIRRVLKSSGFLAVNFVGAPRGKAFAALCHTVGAVFPETVAIRSEEGDDVQTITLFASARKIEFDNGWMDYADDSGPVDRVGLALERLVFRPVLEGAPVLTDDRNPIDVLRAGEVARWRQRTLRTVGWSGMLP